MFSDRLYAAIRSRQNPTVAGLDPKLEYLPASLRKKYTDESGESFEAAAGAILDFNRGLIDALYDVVPAVKPQLACYEMYGPLGMAVYQETVRYAKGHGLIVIADGKRNDIGSTAECYADGHIGQTIVESTRLAAFDADALTVNPYLGSDGVRPFADVCEREDRGIFVLVKTSNRSSGEFQDLELAGGGKLYEAVAKKVDEWGSATIGMFEYSSVGAVVGATYPAEAAVLRRLMPRAFILVPGYGAQGGTAADVVHCFNPDGMGAIVNASRSVMCAYKSEKWKEKYGGDYAAAARAEALDMRENIARALSDAMGL